MGDLLSLNRIVSCGSNGCVEPLYVIFVVAIHIRRSNRISRTMLCLVAVNQSQSQMRKKTGKTANVRVVQVPSFWYRSLAVVWQNDWNSSATGRRPLDQRSTSKITRANSQRKIRRRRNIRSPNPQVSPRMRNLIIILLHPNRTPIHESLGRVLFRVILF